MKPPIQLSPTRGAPAVKEASPPREDYALPPDSGITPGLELALNEPESTATAAAPEKRKEVGYRSHSPDVIQAALIKQGVATPEEIEAILWLHGHGRERKISSVKALAALVDYGDAAMGQVFAGTYTGRISAIAKKIWDYREYCLSHQTFGDEPIIDLQPAQAIARFAEMCRNTNTIGVLTGPSHVGKSSGLKRHATLNNHGRTFYCEMPPGGSPSLFVQALGDAVGIKARLNYPALFQAIVKFFAPPELSDAPERVRSSKLLLLDQCHRTIMGRKLQVATLDLIVALFDQCGIGMVLSATQVFVESIQDTRTTRFFEQIDNRGVARMLLPAELPLEDAVRLAECYGLGEPAGEDRRRLVALLKTTRLGKLTKLWTMARKAAGDAAEPFAWEHVFIMRDTLDDWARGIGVYEDRSGKGGSK